MESSRGINLGRRFGRRTFPKRSGGAWTPAMLRPKLWADHVLPYVFSDSLTTPTTDGGNAQSIKDKSNHGYNGVYNTNRPTWVATTQNGRPSGYVNFSSATKQYMQYGDVNSFNEIASGTGCQITFPMRWAASAANILSNFGVDNSNKGILVYPGTSKFNLILDNGTGTLPVHIQPTDSLNPATIPTGEDHLITIKIKSGQTGGDIQMLVDNCPYIKTSSTVTFPSAGNADAALGLGRPGATQEFRGRCHALMEFDRVLSRNEDDRIARWYNKNRVSLPYKRIAYYGDSILYGTGGIMGSETPAPDLIDAAKGSHYSFTNRAVSGSFSSQDAETAGGGSNNVFVDQWTPYTGSCTGGLEMKSLHNTYVILIGINDVRATDRTSAQILSDIDAITAAILGWAGNRVVLCTLCPADSYTTFSGDATKKQRIRDVNTGILARASADITVVDLFNSALNSGSGSLAASYDAGDGLHPNQAGKQVIADLVGPAV
jgi:lysophospholipase L1-like esterase